MKNNQLKYFLPAGLGVIVLAIVAILLRFGSPGVRTDQSVTLTPSEIASPVVPENIASTNPITKITMQLTSIAFNDGANIQSKYTCDGEDISPPLAITNVPAEAKSLALIVDDPDAPAGDWVHWLVWNISPDTSEIAENTVPKGALQGTTDFGRSGWGGPCPPFGVHHYQFKLFALSAMLDLPVTAKKADLEKAMESHILEKSVLVGLYQRK